MKIGQFSDSFLPIVDGVGRVSHAYAVQLAQKGHEVTVVAPMVDFGFRGGLPYDLCDYFSHELPVMKQYSAGIPALDPHYAARIQNISFDVIHAHAPFITGQEALRLARKRRVPLVGTFHSKYYDDFYKATNAQMIAELGVKFVVNFYERCNEVWTVSENSANVLRSYGYNGEIVVLPNGTPDVSPDPARAAAARSFFSLPDRPTLLYCGQLSWKKNIRLTLEAVGKLRALGVDCSLVLVGQGPDEAEIRALAAQLVPDAIFTGHLHDDQLLYGLYEAADLFVFPSLYDTSGMVVREAASVATPSVVAVGSAPAEPIQDGQNGYLCEDDPDSLCSALDHALSNMERLRCVGANARKTIHLPWSRVADMAVERYQRLIQMGV